MSVQQERPWKRAVWTGHAPITGFSGTAVHLWTRKPDFAAKSAKAVQKMLRMGAEGAAESTRGGTAVVQLHAIRVDQRGTARRQGRSDRAVAPVGRAMLNTSLPQPLEQLPITVCVHHPYLLMCTQGTSAGLGCSATGLEGGRCSDGCSAGGHEQAQGGRGGCMSLTPLGGDCLPHSQLASLCGRVRARRRPVSGPFFGWGIPPLGGLSRDSRPHRPRARTGPGRLHVVPKPHARSGDRGVRGNGHGPRRVPGDCPPERVLAPGTPRYTPAIPALPASAVRPMSLGAAIALLHCLRVPLQPCSACGSIMARRCARHGR